MGRNLISKNTEGIWTKLKPEVSHALPLSSSSKLSESRTWESHLHTSKQTSPKAKTLITPKISSVTSSQSSKRCEHAWCLSRCHSLQTTNATRLACLAVLRPSRASTVSSVVVLVRWLPRCGAGGGFHSFIHSFSHRTTRLQSDRHCRSVYDTLF